jgi:hypothetical protein
VIVHIRQAPSCLDFRPDHNGECLNCDEWADAHDWSTTYCGEHGESMSLEFWFDHVVPNRESCCAALFNRLCRECDKLIPFEHDDASNPA